MAISVGIHSLVGLALGIGIRMLSVRVQCAIVRARRTVAMPRRTGAVSLDGRLVLRDSSVHAVQSRHARSGDTCGNGYRRSKFVR